MSVDLRRKHASTFLLSTYTLQVPSWVISKR